MALLVIRNVKKCSLALLLLAAAGFAQAAAPAKVNTNSRILYHGGPVMTGATPVYLLFYGCWTCGFRGADLPSQAVAADFIATVGLSPYARILTTYPQADGRSPWGAFIFSGAVEMPGYPYGLDLKEADIESLVNDSFTVGMLPMDPSGLYIVLASPDVSAGSTGFCTSGAPPLHGTGRYFGSPYHLAFVGNPMRCPTLAAPQFVAADGSLLPTPNGSFAGDAIVATLAQVLNASVTNPLGNGWFDRYGLENADKCQGKFGSTYVTANGARANVKLAGRDYLIPQNWVNAGKGYCAMSY